MATIKTDEVMSMVDSIFENIGYRRWVEGIECLQNEQIYFEICNIVFYSRSIQLIKINESKGSSGDKLQALIELVSRAISMDLSHINGHLIVRGNMQHLKNLLQVFEYLSQIMVKHEGKARSSVRSAPQADSQERETENFNHTVFTVLATQDEFKETYTESEANNMHETQPRNRKKSKSSKHRGSGHKEYEESDPERLQPVNSNQQEAREKRQPSGSNKKPEDPLNLDYPGKKHIEHMRKRSSGSMKNQSKPQEHKRQMSKLRKKAPAVEQVSLLEANQKAKLAYGKRMYQTIETLERKKLKNIHDNYLQAEQKIIQKASKEQLQIRKDHLKLSRGWKRNKDCAVYLRENLQTNLPQFAQELKQTLRNTKLQERQELKKELQDRNDKMMAVLSDSGDIEEMQRMLVQIYSG